METCRAVISASFGVAAPLPGEVRSQLLQRVDKALYAAKQMGRNQTVKADDHEEEIEFPALEA